MLEEPFFAMLRASRSDCQVDSRELQIPILGNASVIDVLCEDGDKTLASLGGKADMFNRFDLENANSVFRHFGFVRKVTDGLTSQFRSELGVWGVVVDVHDVFWLRGESKGFFRRCQTFSAVTISKSAFSIMDGNLSWTAFDAFSIAQRMPEASMSMVS